MRKESPKNARSEEKSGSTQENLNGKVEIIEVLTGEFLTGESPLDGCKLDPEIPKAAMAAVESISTNAASVDEAQLKTDGDTTKAALDAYREALKTAENKEERERILDYIDKADERQKRNSDSAGSRSGNTQRGSMLVIHGLVMAATAAVALAGVVAAKHFTD